MTRAEFDLVAPNASQATIEANGFFCDSAEIQRNESERKLRDAQCALRNATKPEVVTSKRAEQPLALVLEAEPLALPKPPRHSFFLDCVPPTITSQQKGAFIVPPKAGEKGKGSIRFFTKPEVAKAERQLEALLRQHAPETPREGPIRLTVVFAWPWRASEPAKHRHGVRWKDTAPDTDNLVKMVKDCMSRTGFWTNDGQVASENVDKGWSDKPGISITVESLDSHVA